ncbi:MAG: type II toxin-antitoxin system Phd/YefM family antitoxin [Bacilli bacterium]|jgi:PHD/YefM family antitoxin component YafN of YafNO toxin-antitoxin module|nr:type II toxin-antitoxin system Phd/YefM family antitoxin [Bacilli bacterium]MDD4066127.1 type II toxin-antitoxin system Phd/YefM family antitoxin [Bacilli bacterium]
MTKIIPIRDLKNTSEISELCHKEKSPIFVTKNGYGDLVVMSYSVFEKQYDASKLLIDLRQVYQQLDSNMILDAQATIEKMLAKYGK